MISMPLSEAQKIFFKLPDKLSLEQETLTITRHGKPVLAVLPYDAYEALVETMEIVTDEPTMRTIAKGIRQVEAGETLEWESVKNQLT